MKVAISWRVSRLNTFYNTRKRWFISNTAEGDDDTAEHRRGGVTAKMFLHFFYEFPAFFSIPLPPARQP